MSWDEYETIKVLIQKIEDVPTKQEMLEALLILMKDFVERGLE